MLEDITYTMLHVSLCHNTAQHSRWTGPRTEKWQVQGQDRDRAEERLRHALKQGQVQLRQGQVQVKTCNTTGPGEAEIEQGYKRLMRGAIAIALPLTLHHTVENTAETRTAVALLGLEIDSIPNLSSPHHTRFLLYANTPLTDWLNIADLASVH
jgi:hypothetical protein